MMTTMTIVMKKDDEEENDNEHCDAIVEELEEMDTLTTETENDLDNATNEFDNTNNNINEHLGNTEEQCAQDETPKKNKISNKNCDPHFDNECCGMMKVKQMKEEKVDESMFVQVSHKVVQW